MLTTFILQALIVFNRVPFLAGVVVVVGAVLLHQHQSRSTFRRGEAQMKENAVNGKGTSSPPRRRAPSLLELQLLKPPRANGQPAWNNAHRTGDLLMTHIQQQLCLPAFTADSL